jgi:hypothetical protein
MVIEVVLVLREYRGRMPLIDDQDPVQQLPADAAYESFGDRVRPRCADGCSDHLDSDRGEHSVERGGELGVPVADEEPEVPTDVVEADRQLAGLLGQPFAGRVGGDCEDVDVAGGVFDDEERAERVQGDDLEVE